MKWRCPNIHDLVNILKKLELDLILDTVFDKRLSKLEDLCVIQLREECECLNLDKRGRKVSLMEIIYIYLCHMFNLNTN